MRTYVLTLVFLLAAVAYFVQLTATGYDSMFRAPGPVHTWQVQTADGREVVTLWGQTFSLPADRLAPLLRDGRRYIGRLSELGDLVVRHPGLAGLLQPVPPVSGGAGAVNKIFRLHKM